MSKAGRPRTRAKKAPTPYDSTEDHELVTVSQQSSGKKRVRRQRSPSVSSAESEDAASSLTPPTQSPFKPSSAASSECRPTSVAPTPVKARQHSDRPRRRVKRARSSSRSTDEGELELGQEGGVEGGCDGGTQQSESEGSAHQVQQVQEAGKSGKKRSRVKRERSPSTSGEEYEVKVTPSKALPGVQATPLKACAGAASGHKASTTPKSRAARQLPRWALEKRPSLPRLGVRGRDAEREVLSKARTWARGRDEAFYDSPGQGRLSVGDTDYGRGEGEEEDEEDEDDMSDDFIVNDESGDEENNGGVRCVCGAIDERSGVGGDPDRDPLWVQCTNEDCEYWVHGLCFGITSEQDVPPRFRCHICDPKGKTRRSMRESAAGGFRGKGKDERALMKTYPQLQLYVLLQQGETQGFLRLFGDMGFVKATELAGPLRRSGTTLLMAACEHGRLEAVQALLEAAGRRGPNGGGNRADVKTIALAKDRDGRTALHYAVRSTCAEPEVICSIIDALLLDAAASRLLSMVDDGGYNCLHHAAKRREVGAVVLRNLLGHAGTELCRARDAVGNSPLMVACDEGGEDEAVALAEACSEGVDGRLQGGANGLMRAISRGMVRAAASIVEKWDTDHLRETDDEGATALHYAVEQGDVSTTRALLAKDPALLDKPDFNRTYPLHSACISGVTEVVCVLLEGGARPDVTDSAGWTPLLYSDFRGHESAVLALLAVDPQSQLQLLGELLRGPRGHDERVVKVIKGLTGVPSFHKFLNTFIAKNLELLESSLCFVLDRPELLDLANKKAYLERKLDQLRSEAAAHEMRAYGYLHQIMYSRPALIRLSRSRCWWDFRRQCSDAAFMRRNVTLQFADGVGIGPGVEREVLERLVADVVKGGSGEAAFLEQTDDESSSSYVVSSPATADINRSCFALGVLLGHGLLHKKVIGINLNPVFLKLVLGRKVLVDDIGDLDAGLQRSFEQLLSQEGVESWGLTFTWTKPGCGDVELCPGGEEKAVTDQNKAEYVSLVVSHRTEGVMGEQAQHVRKGLLEVLRDGEGRLLKLFTPQEFSVLVSGVQKLDVEEWEPCTVYQHGYYRGAEQITWFWDFCRGLNQEELALLLKFATGASRLPVGGFKDLNPRFAICPKPYSVNRPLPGASTCFNLLKLPLYPSRKDLEKAVFVAIRFGSEGFEYT